MLTRRWVLAALPAATCSLSGRLGRVFAAGAELDGFAVRWAALEAKSGGRLGVYLLDTGTGAHAGHRADERFPMCSTAKLPAVAALLARVDQGRERLDRVAHFTEKQILPNSPVTSKRVGTGVTLRDACEAAMTLSDNTAANLIFEAIGGPQGVTAFARSIGDDVTRLDRNEPALNECLPGDPRDTTSPAAIAEDLRKLVLGNALSAASRELLIGWLLACKTGEKRLRAGLPAAWKEGDKTGTGNRGTSNDVAIVWPVNRAPIVIAAYLTGSSLDDAARETVLADVGGSVGAVLRG